MGMVSQPVRGQGTYAECVSTPEEIFAPIPDGRSTQQAAAAPLIALTTAQLLGKVTTAGLAEGAFSIPTPPQKAPRDWHHLSPSPQQSLS